MLAEEKPIVCKIVYFSVLFIFCLGPSSSAAGGSAGLDASFDEGVNEALRLVARVRRLEPGVGSAL